MEILRVFNNNVVLARDERGGEVILTGRGLGFQVRKGIALDYPLRAEVAHLYPDELAVAERIVAFVNERLPEPLPAEEAVPVALHLVNAGFASGDLSFTYQTGRRG